MLEKIKAVLGVIKRMPLYIFMLAKRDKNLYIFGAWFGEKYADNSKAMFEYIVKNHSEIKCVWLTRNKLVYDQLKKNKLNVEMLNSIRGIYYQLKAKVAFSCVGVYDFNGYLLGGCTHIELWHGVGGGKTVGFDEHPEVNKYRRELYHKIEAIPYRNRFFVCTSEEMKRVFKSAFRLPDDHYLLFGQPRNDSFFDKSYKYQTVDSNNFRNKKVILYLPTHRKNGTEKICCQNLFDLKALNNFCLANNCIFIIKKHFYHVGETEKLEQFENIVDWTKFKFIDTNELLMMSDYLITDYSSVSADYLLLNKPIFYYCYDYESYLSEDRDMYWDYDQISPGSKSRTFEELLDNLKKVIIDHDDEYTIERTRVLNMFYGKQARKMVAPDIFEFVRNNIK